MKNFAILNDEDTTYLRMMKDDFRTKEEAEKYQLENNLVCEDYFIVELDDIDDRVNDNFEWNLSKEKFEYAKKSMRNFEYSDEDFIGEVLLGGICFDFLLRDCDDRLILDCDIFVANVDDGYAKNKDNRPYCVIGGIIPIHYDNIDIDNNLQAFKSRIEKEIKSYILSSKFESNGKTLLDFSYDSSDFWK